MEFFYAPHVREAFLLRSETVSFSSIARNTPAGLKSPAVMVAALLLAGISLAAAADEKPITYEDHVAAILKKNCAACHGDGKQEGGLNLVSYSGVMKGAGGGEIVIAGRSGGSRLIEVITAPRRR